MLLILTLKPGGAGWRKLSGMGNKPELVKHSDLEYGCSLCPWRIEKDTFTKAGAGRTEVQWARAREQHFAEHVRTRHSGKDSDETIAAFAATVGMSSTALEEVLDCIESKMSYRYAADLLRKQFNTPLSVELWARIRKWAGHPAERDS